MVYFLPKNSAISKKKTCDTGKSHESYAISGKKIDPFKNGGGDKIGLLAKLFNPVINNGASNERTRNKKY